MRSGATRGRRGPLLIAVLLLSTLALALPGAALAAEGTSSYGQTPTTPTTPTTSTPTTGTSPSKEEKSTPATGEESTKASSTAPATEKAKSLPFTGLDLRWTVAFGLLLVGAGFSIVVIQRRGRRGGAR